MNKFTMLERFLAGGIFGWVILVGMFALFNFNIISINDFNIKEIIILNFVVPFICAIICVFIDK